LVTFVLSAWVLPKKYEVAAYVTVAAPNVQYTTMEGLGITPSNPDIRSVPEIAQSKTILEQVKADKRVVSLLPKDGASWLPDVQVYTIGTTLVRFQVTDTDPERAAMFVNVWAEKTADWVEVNYGIGEFVLNLNKQIQQARQAYTQAQSQLETFLSTDKTSALQARLASLQTLEGCLEGEIKLYDVLMNHLNDLEKTLLTSASDLSATQMWQLGRIEQMLSMSGLCGSSASTLAVTQPSISLPGSNIERVHALQQALQNLAEDDQKMQGTVEQEMLNLQVEMERMDAQRNEYVRQRDQAKKLYEQLTYQQGLINGVLQESGRIATVGVSAQVPSTPSAPRPLFNAILAGVSMAVLASAAILLRDSWLNTK
jgi:uncharacterized protein involved in exopolysaccharide biosynthesis